jgi:hypothetical protein
MASSRRSELGALRRQSDLAGRIAVPHHATHRGLCRWLPRAVASWVLSGGRVTSSRRSLRRAPFPLSLGVQLRLGASHFVSALNLS